MVPAALPDSSPRIAIDARPFSASPCGYTVYLGAVIASLRRAGLDMILLSNQPLQPIYAEIEGLPTRVFGAAGDLKWEQRDLPALLDAEPYPLYFTAANRGIPWRRNGRTRYVLGLLDVIPYLFFRDYFMKRIARRQRVAELVKQTAAQLIAVWRADAILTISQQSAADIKRLSRRRDVTSCLIPLDVEPVPAATPRPQFVYVGGVDARKRVDVLLHAFARFAPAHPSYRLVLIGGNYRAVEPLIGQLGLGDRVVVTGFVSHEDKVRLLAESCAMVYPSLYEGYGLAIAEGFQAHIPVIAGQGGSQAEIGGAAVRYVDPLAADEIAAAMAEMTDPAVRQQWIVRGREQLAVLSDPSVEAELVGYFTEQLRLARGGA